MTDDVLADLAKMIKMPSPAAMPPAMVPMAPVQGPDLSAQLGRQLAPDNTQSPFGQAPYPVDGSSQ